MIVGLDLLRLKRLRAFNLGLSLPLHFDECRISFTPFQPTARRIIILLVPPPRKLGVRYVVTILAVNEKASSSCPLVEALPFLR